MGGINKYNHEEIWWCMYGEILYINIREYDLIIINHLLI
jgi:hypothetical protein